MLEGGAGEVLLEEFVGGAEFCVNGQVDRGGDLLVTASIMAAAVQCAVSP